MVTPSHIMLTLEYAEGAGESHIAAGRLRAKRRRKRRRVGGERRRGDREGDERELLSFSVTAVCLSAIIHCNFSPFQGGQLH